MQHDAVIWQVLRHNHCSFMAKMETGVFCRNPYNVTGTCNESSCPLANSRYATIRELNGVFYLYMKTIERSHMPNKTWERVKLPRNYAMALEIIDKHLAYWPKLLVHKTKQRLTKLAQMRIRSRKLVLKTREEIMTMPRKEIKREARREDKAKNAAQIQTNIEKELAIRLNRGFYPKEGPVADFFKLLETEKEEEEKNVEFVETDYEEEEEDFEDFTLSRITDDVDDDDNDELDDDDDEEEKKQTVIVHSKRGRKGSARRVEKDPFKSEKKVKLHVEVEREVATERRTSVH